MEEQDLVVDAVVPIGAAMAAGPFDIIVRYFFLQQFLMQGAVDGEEEVARAAVEDEPKVAIVEAVGGVHHRVCIPNGFVGAVIAEIFFDAPVVGEGPEVDAAAGGARRAEEVFMMHG